MTAVVEDANAPASDSAAVTPLGVPAPWSPAAPGWVVSERGPASSSVSGGKGCGFRLHPAHAATSTALAAAGGTSATACPVALAVVPSVPSVNAVFSPASVGENTVSTLTITLTNPNAFDLTQASFTATLPSGLTISTTQPGSTSCTGALMTTSFTAGSLSISDANIPASGSCTLSVGLSAAIAGSYTIAIPANALSTGPAGANTDAASAALTVTAPSKSGGGSLAWAQLLVLLGVVGASRWRRRG